MSPCRIRIAVAGLGILAAFQVAPVVSLEAQANRRPGYQPAHFVSFCRSDKEMQGKFYFSPVLRGEPGVSNNDLE